MEDEYTRDELYKKVLFGVTVIVVAVYLVYNLKIWK
jgi:hypothetical protein